MAVRSARTCSIVTPGFMRPKTWTVRSLRGEVSPVGPSGTQSRWNVGKAKRGGMTPMIVCGRPLIGMARPTTPGSDW